jgi:hypothetical protein
LHRLLAVRHRLAVDERRRLTTSRLVSRRAMNSERNLTLCEETSRAKKASAAAAALFLALAPGSRTVAIFLPYRRRLASSEGKRQRLSHTHTQEICSLIWRQKKTTTTARGTRSVLRAPPYRRTPAQAPATSWEHNAGRDQSATQFKHLSAGLVSSAPSSWPPAHKEQFGRQARLDETAGKK